MTGYEPSASWFDTLKTHRRRREHLRNLDALGKRFDSAGLQKLTGELRRDLGQNGVEGVMSTRHFKPFPRTQHDVAASGIGEGIALPGRGNPMAVGLTSRSLDEFFAILHATCGSNNMPKLALEPLLLKVFSGVHEAAHLLDGRNAKMDSAGSWRGFVSDGLLREKSDQVDPLSQFPAASPQMKTLNQGEAAAARDNIKHNLQESLADAAAARFMLVRYGDNPLIPAFIKGIAAFRRQGFGDGAHRTSSALDAILAEWKGRKHVDPEYRLSAATRDALAILRGHPTLVADIAAELFHHNELSMAAAQRVTNVGQRLDKVRDLARSATTAYCTPKTQTEKRRIFRSHPEVWREFISDYMGIALQVPEGVAPDLPNRAQQALTDYIVAAADGDFYGLEKRIEQLAADKRKVEELAGPASLVFSPLHAKALVGMAQERIMWLALMQKGDASPSRVSSQTPTGDTQSEAARMRPNP